jgi:hypothetical protein
MESTAVIDHTDNGLPQKEAASGPRSFETRGIDTFASEGFITTHTAAPYHPASAGISGPAYMAKIKALTDYSPMPSGVKTGLEQASMAVQQNMRLEALKLAIAAYPRGATGLPACYLIEMAATFEDYLMHGMKKADVEPTGREMQQTAEAYIKKIEQDREACRSLGQWADMQRAALVELTKTAREGGEDGGDRKPRGMIADTWSD